MTESVATPKKSKSAAKTKKPKVAATHPKTADMVNAAIAALKERGGSSLQAIKKYIAANYKVDADKLAPFIRKYLKSAVVSGGLVQTKGKGASGSFRMAGSAGTGGAKTAAKPKKAAAKPKKAKAAPATPKKAAKPKKSPAKSKPKKAAPVKKAKPAPKTAVKKAKPVKAAKKKPAKASPKKKAAPKKSKK